MTDFSGEELPLAEVAVQLGEHPSRTFARLASGELRGRKHGRHWLVNRESAEALIKAHASEPQPAT